MEVVGQIIGGGVARILIREKSGIKLELGDLLVVDENEKNSLILQINDLEYKSQVPQPMRELISGMELEGQGASLEFMEPELRNYIVSNAKAILQIKDSTPRIPKMLPTFFHSARNIREDDLQFLTKPKNPLYLGDVRSGSKLLNAKVYVDAAESIPHHILIPATTGRGKSNLVKVMLWSILDLENFGILVLDPHDEYYGRNETCLKDHPNNENLIYYSPVAPPGANTLIINIESIRPHHFNGIISFTSAQHDAIYRYYNEFSDKWILKIVEGVEIDGVDPRTIQVLGRKLDNILGIYIDSNGEFQSRNRTFNDIAGKTTIKDMVRSLENGNIVVIDTSRLMGDAELLVGSIITGTVFNRYQRYKSEGKLNEKPIMGVVIEEAPRVLGKDVIASQGHNIYSTIAREGRKFNMGLIAITQLVSLIPKTILANMNTKIILGNEMAQERAEIIASASQDLSDDNRTIASLDKGEAIISSIFTKFAVPVQVPLFEDYIKEYFENKGIESNKDKNIAFI
jgi:DNA helicase HerA-like ATPase